MPENKPSGPQGENPPPGPEQGGPFFIVTNMLVGPGLPGEGPERRESFCFETPDHACADAIAEVLNDERDESLLSPFEVRAGSRLTPAMRLRAKEQIHGLAGIADDPWLPMSAVEHFGADQVILSQIHRRCRGFEAHFAAEVGWAPGADPPEYSPSPRSKPGGYTARELREEAEAAGESVSAERFRLIRKAVGLPPSPVGTAGQYRRFTNAEIRKLADAAENGSFRNGKAVAGAWRALISDESQEK